MVPGDEARTIQQNPALDNSVPIFRSKNEASGMEFTWSLWLWITSGEVNFKSTNNNQWKHVFHIGSKIKEGEYITWNSIPNQSPGVWLTPKLNNLRIF